MARIAVRHWWRDDRAWVWLHTLGVLGAYAVLAARSAPVGERLEARGPCGDTDGAAQDRVNAPLVSIIVPARDEERNIRACVSSLLEQDYPQVEVIVVDDASRDATPRILAELRADHPRGERLNLVRVNALPAGWAGKPHALHVGARHAHGEWLLFTDADTWHAPLALRTTLGYAIDRRLDLVSLATAQDLPGFWNKVLMPMAYMGISAQYPADAVNDPKSDVALANGQYILLRRAVYDDFGGYALPRLRATVVDDRDLAREVKSRGFRLRLADGRELVRTHMYRGLRDHWRGWSKNVYVGSRGGALLFATLLVGLFSITVAPALLLAVALTRRRAWLLPATLQLTAMLTFRCRLDRVLGVPVAYAATHPLAGAIFTAILGRAAWRKLTKRGVEWRGRHYLA